MSDAIINCGALKIITVKHTRVKFFFCTFPTVAIVKKKVKLIRTYKIWHLVILNILFK